MSDLPPWLRPAKSGTCVAIAVQPGAKVSALAGTHGDRLKVKVAAPPVDGEANAALVKIIAQVLGLPTRHVTIKEGTASRRKVVEVEGLTPMEVWAVLKSHLGSEKDG